MMSKSLARDQSQKFLRPSSSSRFLLTAILLVLSALNVRAQETIAQPPDSPDSIVEVDSSSPTGLFTDIVQVRVMNVDVIVTDRSGQSVAGLTREDFELRVDGEIEPISNFYAEAGGQRWATSGSTKPKLDSTFRSVEDVKEDPAHRAHVVVLVDHTRLSGNNRKRALRSLREAIAGLSPEDLVAVVGLEGSLVFYSDFLFDRKAIGRILDDISRISVRSDINEVERREIFGELTRGQTGGILGRTSTVESGAVTARIRSYAAQEFARSVASLREIERVVTTLGGVPGRKAMIYVGEGIPNRPGEGLFVEWRNRFGGGENATELGIRRVDFNTDYTRTVGNFDLIPEIEKLAASANHAGVTLYSIDAEGNHGGDIRSALTEQGATSEAVSVIDENFRAPLEYASKATGGRLLRSSGQLAEQLETLLQDFDTFYSLGFTPRPDWDEGSAHKIEVKVNGKKLVVRHREEVRLPKPDEREASATLAALMYQSANNPLDFHAIPSTGVARQDGSVSLPVVLEIPVKNLGFIPQGAKQAGSLTIYVSIKDQKGDPGRIQKIPFHLAIPEEHMEAAMADLAHYPLLLVLRSGDQYAAIGVRDNVNGSFSAVRIDVSKFAEF